jgi:hypothetical protein
MSPKSFVNVVLSKKKNIDPTAGPLVESKAKFIELAFPPFVGIVKTGGSDHKNVDGTFHMHSSTSRRTSGQSALVAASILTMSGGPPFIHSRRISVVRSATRRWVKIQKTLSRIAFSTASATSLGSMP